MNGFLNRSKNIHNFSNDSIPDLSDKVIIVTGGNQGLGLHSIMHLLIHNPAKLYLTARSQANFDSAVSEIKSRHPNVKLDNLHFIEMELTSLPSIASAAKKITADTTKINVLLNNAGIMGGPTGIANGLELTLATNYFGPALFTNLLLPLLSKTAETEDVRIINVSSGAYKMATTNFADKKTLDLERTDMANTSDGLGNTLPRYAPTKLAQVLQAQALAKRYPKIMSVSIMPGRVATGLLNEQMKKGGKYAWFQKSYDWAVGAIPVEQGSLTQVWAAVTDRKLLKNGAVYAPIGVEDPFTKVVTEENMEALWKFTEDELRRLGY